MPGRTAASKAPWNDKFKAPSLDLLRGGFPDEQVVRLLDELRQVFLRHPGIHETVAWHGVPWRWTLVYGCGNEKGRALGYIIPDPSKLQVCVPLTIEIVQTLPFRRLKKAIRDGIIFSRAAAGVHWPCWEVATAGAIQDVQELVDRKIKFNAAHESVSAAGS